MYLYCNQLEGDLPDEFRSMSALKSLFLNGNQNLTGPLPSSWGTSTNILRLASLNLQNTSINGSIPPKWSSVILPQGVIALGGADVCGAWGLTGSYSVCIDDIAACDPINQSYFIAHSALYLPPACSNSRFSCAHGDAINAHTRAISNDHKPVEVQCPAVGSGRCHCADWDHRCFGWFSFCCRQCSSCRRYNAVGDVWRRRR